MPTGRELNQRWGVGARHALYRETGDWYHVLKRFPAALFDANGYVRFESRTDLEMHGISVSKGNGKDWLSVPDGIAALRGYSQVKGVEAPSHSAKKPEGVALREYDESERLAVQQSGTLTYRHLHNKMTNAFGQMFGALNPEQGQGSNNRYDVLIRGYGGAGRDLLVEAKPDPNKGSLRIAIGQLYDYRRFLRNRAATDLAVLTIGKPDKSYIDLLVADRDITVLWFEDETCKRLNGEGSAWQKGLRPGNQLK
jgi:hypothetical protein